MTQPSDIVEVIKRYTALREEVGEIRARWFSRGLDLRRLADRLARPIDNLSVLDGQIVERDLETNEVGRTICGFDALNGQEFLEDLARIREAFEESREFEAQLRDAGLERLIT